MTVQPQGTPTAEVWSMLVGCSPKVRAFCSQHHPGLPMGPYEESRQGSWPVISDLATHDEGTLTNAPFISLKTTPLKIRGVLESWGSLCSSRHPSCLRGRDQGSVVYVP